jgi:2-oxoglutarate dehydrogenase E1 component
MDLNALIDSGFLSLSILEEKYEQYKKDPASLDSSWRPLFDQLESLREPASRISGNRPASSISSSDSFAQPHLAPADIFGHSVLYYPKLEISPGQRDARILHLIQAYRTYGHLLAKTNPLASRPKEEPPQLDLEVLGFSKQDLATHFPTCGLLEAEEAPLLDIINALKSIYCGTIGIEYMGLHSPEFEQWLQEHIEPMQYRMHMSIDAKHNILDLLNKSEVFESFLHTKYVGQKRFSLEGAETLIPILSAVIEKGAALGQDEFVIGMAHRGRLNVLCNIFDKSFGDIFSEFEEGYIPASVEGSGDVKYHKGFYSEAKTVHGHKIKLTLTPNPSHLEAVDPVVEGQVRARQVIRGDDLKCEKVIPILIHGDAAISGQGPVYETMQLSRLEGYSTGGTIHIIVNNQIGFTTVPKDARSTLYCTDIARAFDAPVFHVNAEDPEGCVYATQVAVELRQKFHCDVFIELNCYRKYGHNETDEPAFTQPLEYGMIRSKQPIRDIYRDILIHQGVVEKYVAEALETEFKAALQEAQKAKRFVKAPSDKKEISPPGSKTEEFFMHTQTGVPKAILQEIGVRICSIPPGFSIHPKLAVLNKARLAMIKDGEGAGHPLDWGMGELLAYGSLLWEGTHVRLSGQDSCRGTFSHRHALLMDQVKEDGYVPLKHLKERQGRFDIYNSPLSEFAVLGFEFGYSVANPDALVVWEAQFGDFSNGAQVIIDQFIASAEQKWNQKFALTLFLPHGYEGQGPEHSSARIERFLTLAGDQNMQVVNPTTPAQLFHLLRRQILRPLKKPLIVFTPKGLLRHPACISRLDDLSQGSFQELIDDPTQPKRARRLILCSGRIYYDLSAERDKLAVDDMAIVRIEQLYPLDVQRLKDIFRKYGAVRECIWVQEEPSNMGAWSFIRPILNELMPKEIDLKYVGRQRSASTAAGSHALHKKEHAAIMDALFGTKEPTIFDIAGHHKA